MAHSKFQKFDTATINRTEIKEADYNPRIIGEEEKKRLQKVIKQHGLVEPLVWNRRTGTLVSGHQRLSIIDALEGNAEYDLIVSVVDVDETEEKKLNVLLNNPSTQGEWDVDKLLNMAVNTGIGLDEFGFSQAQSEILFGSNEVFESFFADTKEVEKAKADLKDIKKNRKEQAEKMQEEQGADFYFMVVCESAQQKGELLNRLGVGVCETYIASNVISRNLAQKG